MAHLYRGEMYRSKIWRTRLDTTTNWAVVTTGIALSITFSSVGSSALPLILVSLLVLVFLAFEGRRYRYFDIWRTRVRVLEVRFYGPMLRGQGVVTEDGWNQALAEDYRNLRFHISYWEAVGRRLRRNYAWIFVIQLVSYIAKLCIHPTPLSTVEELWMRAAVGPVPGEVVLFTGALFHFGWIALAVLTVRGQYASGRVAQQDIHEDQLQKFIKN